MLLLGAVALAVAVASAFAVAVAVAVAVTKTIRLTSLISLYKALFKALRGLRGSYITL